MNVCVCVWWFHHLPFHKGHRQIVILNIMNQNFEMYNVKTQFLIYFKKNFLNDIWGNKTLHFTTMTAHTQPFLLVYDLACIR